MINIFQIEKTQKVPLGIRLFLNKYKNKNEISFRMIENDEKVNDWIFKLKENDIVLFPIYYNPLPIINIIIDRIKKHDKSIKTYACGKLAIEQPNKVKNNIIVNDIIINNDIPFIFYSDYLKKDFKEKSLDDFVGKIDFNIYRENKNIDIIPTSSIDCKNNCYFCKQNSYKNISFVKENSYSLTPLQLIDFLPNEKIDILRLYYNNILQFDFDQVLSLVKESYKKMKFKKLRLYACSSDMLKHVDRLRELSFNDEFKIEWNIGLESFSETQLKRFNKNKLQDNIDLVNQLNKNKKTNKNDLFVFLFLIFDPWVTPDEIYESYFWYNKININCGNTNKFLTLAGRTWNPASGTKLIERAKKENLLKLDFFNEFDNYVWTKNTGNELPWKFKHKRSLEIYNRLSLWRDNYNALLIKAKREKISPCTFCSGRIKGIHKNEYSEIKELILKFIKEDNRPYVKNINRIFSKIKKSKLRK